MTDRYFDKNRIIIPLLMFLFTAMTYAKAETPLSLQSALDLAIRQNPGQQSRRLEVSKANEQQDIARAASLPKLDFTMSATQYANPSLVHPIREQGVFPPLDDVIYDYGVAIKLPLYAGGKLTQGVVLADYGSRISTERRRLSEQELIYNVSSVYFKIQHLSALVRTYTARIDSLSEQEKHVRLRQEVGKASRLDYLKISGLLTKARHDRVQIENHLRESWTLLYELLGEHNRPGSEALVRYEIKPVETSSFTLEKFIQQAQLHRPELNIAKFRVKAGEAQVEIADAERLPEVLLMAGYRQSSGSELDFYDDWNVGVQLSVPVFDGGERRSRVSQARISRKQSVYDLEKIRLSVNKQVQDAWHRYIEANSRLQVTETSIAEAYEALSIEKLRYEQGVGIITDLLDAESGLLSAQADRLQSEFDMIVARFGLLFASGRLDQERVVTLLVPETRAEQETSK
jgi:TolC family type I secretion outer membrane protein